MKQVWRRFGILAICTALVVTACTPDQVVGGCPLPDVLPALEQPDVNIEVYVDGTPSMQGYVSNPDSRYSQTIEKLLRVLKVEPVGLDGQPRPLAGTTYFRLGNRPDGKKLDVISEAEYRQAKLSDFYSGTSLPRLPLLQVAEIDAAIVPPPSDHNKLTIVITDLYQREEDTAKIVTNLQKYVEANHQRGAVGILGIRSEFNGIIYSESPAGPGDFRYTMNSAPTRPFYVVFVGQLDDVHFYLDNLKRELQFDQGIESAILSPYRLHHSVAFLNRQDGDNLSPEQRQQVSIPISSVKQGNLVVNLTDPHTQPLSLRKTEPLTWSSQVSLSPISHVLMPSKLEIGTTAMSFDTQAKSFAPDASLQGALSFPTVPLAGETLSVEAQVNPGAISTSGIYFFQADATVNTSVDTPIAEPEWWSTWSGTKSQREGNKTTDLSLFMTDLKNRMVSLMRQQPLLVSRLCYVIHKN